MSGIAPNASRASVRPPRISPLLLSTAHVHKRHRHAWLSAAIGRQYANVEISAPKHTELFNEMAIYPWGEGQLSVIRSNPISLRRSAATLEHLHTDAVFVVMLLAGAYCLRQDGREVHLKAGEISLYDVRRPHRIDCPRQFSKLVIQIPGALMRSRVPAIERYSAAKISPETGFGAIVATFLQQSLRNLARLNDAERGSLGVLSVDMLAGALTHALPPRRRRSRRRAESLAAIKVYVETNLRNPGLNAANTATATGYSQRYTNELFSAQGTSLMRYVWSRRLELGRDALVCDRNASEPIAEIALRCGFSDPAHFSRAFKQKFGVSPRAYERQYRS
jgi:AraC family transcriptional regulator, positive regulator of tynA and feaB